MRRITTLTSATLLALALGVGTVSAGNGPPGPAFYVDEVVYRTVGTPTDLSGTGAPAHSFDVIYALGEDANGEPLMNVAEAAPGDADYNGGRWMVLPITWNVDPVQLISDEQVLMYEADGLLEIGDEPVKQFVCPVIKVQGNQ
jgi:hypothetical protein